MESHPYPGSLVAYWDEGSLAFAVAAGEEKQRVRLIVPGGREERVPPARIAFVLDRGSAPGASPEARAEAGRRAAAAFEEAVERAATLEVPVLWSIAREEAKEHDLASLASLALGEDSAPARAACALALVRDGVHFVRKGERWEARGEDAVATILDQEERVARRSREQAAAIDSFRAAARGGVFEPSDSEAEKRCLAALEEVALHDLAAPEAARALAATVLDAVAIVGDRPSERAFKLLRRTGRFGSDDDNLVVLRHRLRTDFPAEVLEAASRAAERGFSSSGRVDRTDLDVVSVDSARTSEIDDVLSIVGIAGGVRIGIHIADPSAFVAAGDPVDLEAAARSTSHYLPDLKIPMLPPPISKDSASLVPDLDRPVLSFLVDLDDRGEIRGFDLSRGIVRSRARLDYHEADLSIEGGSGRWAAPLRALHDALRLHEARRIEAGAVVLEVEEADIHVEDGRAVLERLGTGSPSRRVVSEAMILAGEVGARFCAERSIPIPYRRQQAPSPLPDLPREPISDPVAVRALRRTLRRAEVSLEPGPHFALGLPAYAQVTSPLRRYQDLVSHRQILAFVEGRPLPYSAEEVRAIAATTEEAETEARQAERSADLYWRLRYLEQTGARTVEAIVVDVRPLVVRLTETLLEEKVPSLGGAKLGERVTLRIERVNPRAELLLLRPA